MSTREAFRLRVCVDIGSNGSSPFTFLSVVKPTTLVKELIPHIEKDFHALYGRHFAFELEVERLKDSKKNDLPGRFQIGHLMGDMSQLWAIPKILKTPKNPEPTENARGLQQFAEICDREIEKIVEPPANGKVQKRRRKREKGTATGQPVSQKSRLEEESVLSADQYATLRRHSMPILSVAAAERKILFLSEKTNLHFPHFDSPMHIAPPTLKIPTPIASTGPLGKGASGSTKVKQAVTT